MIRTCDGTDPNLLDGPTSTAGPCACGLTFSDVDRSVVWPHVFIPTADEKAALLAMHYSIAVDELNLPDDAPALATLTARPRLYARR